MIANLVLWSGLSPSELLEHPEVLEHLVEAYDAEQRQHRSRNLLDRLGRGGGRG